MEAQSIQTLAEGCRRFVAQALQIELDGEPDTLPILDHYMTLVESDEEAVLELIVASAGAYFGEVFCNAFPTARWNSRGEDYSQWRIELSDVFLSFNPLGMAREAIMGATVPGWNAHLEMLERDRGIVAQSLERLGPIDSDDYYRLSVRFEVLEQAVTILRGAALSRGEVARPFGPEVYRTALDADDDPGNGPPSGDV